MSHAAIAAGAVPVCGGEWLKRRITLVQAKDFYYPLRGISIRHTLKDLAADRTAMFSILPDSGIHLPGYSKPFSPTAAASALALSLGMGGLVQAGTPEVAGPHPGAVTVSLDQVPSAGVAEATAPPALQLAQTYRAGIPVSDYWVSEKLDGVRAFWDGAHLVSRGGNRFHAPAWFTRGFPRQALDGELWMGRNGFERLMSTVRDREPDQAAWRQVRYRVFDLPKSPRPFGQRYGELQVLLRNRDSPYIQPVAHYRVGSEAELQARLAQVTAAGGEGLMLHRNDARYTPGRHAGLLKLKPYLDAEARVLAQLPGRGKYRGMLGALLVEMPDGTRFRIGTGFTDTQRRNPPPVGSLVTFKYHGRTGRGVPRFASFLRIRELPRTDAPPPEET